jgi:hypothetical protein
MEEKMKTVVRLMLVAVLLIVALPLTSVSAQDNPENAGFFIQQATSGTMTSADNGYTLVLEGVGDTTTWLTTSPDVSYAPFPTGMLVLSWASASDLVGQAMLQIGQDVYTVNLSAPEFNAETGAMTYNATVNVPEGAKDVTVPETFDAASLYIVANTDLVNSLVTGAQSSGARPIVCFRHYIAGTSLYFDDCTWVP